MAMWLVRERRERERERERERTLAPLLSRVDVTVSATKIHGDTWNNHPWWPLRVKVRRVSAVQTAKGRIAASAYLTKSIISRKRRIFIYFPVGRITFPSKLPPSPGGSAPLPNVWFFSRSHPIHSPNGSSTGLFVFTGFTVVTNRQTDHATSVAIGRTLH